MSQPPPPPNQPPHQPPSGGFGPAPGAGEPPEQQPGMPQPPSGPPQQPPQPPPAGYGYPQQPPQPGYGYPQAPPPGAPGYGSGFNSPQPPGAPGFPTPPPGKPGGGNNGKLLAIIASVVAVVLIAGVAVFFVAFQDDDEEAKGNEKSSQQGGSSGDSKSQNTKAKQIVDFDAPEVKSVTSVVGGWATDQVFAKSSIHDLVGFSLPDGKKKWQIDLKGGVCAASNEQTSDGKVAALVQETVSSKAECTRMVVIDLNKGKLVWDKDLPGDTSLGADNIAISGDTAAAAWSGGSAAFSISSGKQLWAAKPSNCRDSGYVGGAALGVVVECGGFDNEQISVQKLNPKTGKPTTKFKAPQGVETARIASVEPLTVVVGAGTSTPTDVMTVDDSGKLKAKLTLGERYNSPCSVEANSCYSMAVGKDAFYLSTAQHAGSTETSRTNEVMAFDWATGKAKWKSEAGEKRTIMPFKTEDDNVIAYKLPAYGTGGEIVKIDPSQGKQTSMLKMPISDPGKGEQAVSVSEFSAHTPLIYESNRFFLLQKNISERKEYEKDQPKLAVGFAAD